ncbi:hypothetical protein KAFR_0E03200 [Kazachstania africana CBS 2517]|uniref:PIG-P domain-containing protein n=1 Tax=Kazachstania africana (strain ATCC 22294 / BCRC 22015 / CBS 2517 / CECT 1963 / NBRC 1671 / NRRL Y-8276) TaxID=1071382 RepID=H2AVS2_KAZAF|nr:hypothetical protein KAFR_0E03200 [Kazachstania africana CBS 2517]CCF58472.1 hypothetical protein KAFR_0E03200 [Kazachstania africana CBS 2517]
METSSKLRRSTKREYYWFSRHFIVTSLLIFILIWSFVGGYDNKILPNRNWVLILQCIVLMGMLFAYFGLIFYNDDILAPNLDDMRTITDSHACIVTTDKDDLVKNFAFKETSGVIDLPIMDVCDVLYRER